MKQEKIEQATQVIGATLMALGSLSLGAVELVPIRTHQAYVPVASEVPGPQAAGRIVPNKKSRGKHGPF